MRVMSFNIQSDQPQNTRWRKRRDFVAGILRWHRPDSTGLQELVAALPAALAVIHERRRELRRTLAERYGVSRDLLNAFYNDQFLTLTGDAQKSILALFPEGAWGMDLPTVARLNLAPWAVRV